MTLKGRRRRWRTIPIVLAIVLLAAACSSSDTDDAGATTAAPSGTEATDTTADTQAPESTEGTADPIKVGLVQIDLTHPFHVGEVEGAKEAARRYGFELIVTSGEGDVTKQINAFENLLEQGVDVISVNAIDVSAYGPAFEKAKEAGVPVVLQHSESPAVATTLGFAERATGQAVGEHAVELLIEKNGEARGQVAVLQGLLGQGLNADRTGGFTDVMDQYDTIEVVALEPTNWDPQKATEITENLLVAYPNLDLIYGLSDGLTVPAAQVVDRAGKSDQIILVSVDGSDFALEAIEAGTLASTYLYAPEYSGFWKAWVPFRIASGETFPAGVLMGGALVTTDNVAEVADLVADMKANIETFKFERPLQDIYADFAAN